MWHTLMQKTLVIMVLRQGVSLFGDVLVVLPQVLMKMVLVSVKMQVLLLMALLLSVEMQLVQGMQYLWAGMQRGLVVMLPL